ncbi:hypothetical protein DSECCO2_544470 [anaerobic digester metagenome]
MDLPDHLPNGLLGDRQDPQGNVLHQLDEGASHTEGEHLPERRIGLSADDQFKPRRRLLLDDDTLDLCFGIVRLGVCDDLVECLFRNLLGGYTDDNTAGIAFVDDLGRVDLHDDRKTDLLCHLACFGSGLDDRMFGHRYAVLFQEIV